MRDNPTGFDDSRPIDIDAVVSKDQMIRCACSMFASAFVSSSTSLLALPATELTPDRHVSYSAHLRAAFRSRRRRLSWPRPADILEAVHANHESRQVAQTIDEVVAHFVSFSLAVDPAELWGDVGNRTGWLTSCAHIAWAFGGFKK
jgi:hypothetical protein